MPLLERAKFCAIFSQNLDEFFQVRVAGLQDQVAAGLGRTSPTACTPSEQLARDRRTGRRARRPARARVPRRSWRRRWPTSGIRFSGWDELDDDDRKYLVEEFETRIFPVLTPLAVDPGHPFPYISTLSLNLAVVVRDPVTDRAPLRPGQGALAAAPVRGHARRRALRAARAGHRRPPRPALSRAWWSRTTFAFRVTRNADLTLEEEEADDLLAAVEIELRRRRFGAAVRLEVDAA